jgi:hypothetical protein
MPTETETFERKVHTSGLYTLALSIPPIPKERMKLKAGEIVQVIITRAKKV